MSFRAIARLLKRVPSTISREVRRHAGARQHYQAHQAQHNRLHRRLLCRPRRKLLPGSERFELIIRMLKRYLSPEQIAGQLKIMDIPSLRNAYCAKKPFTTPHNASAVATQWLCNANQDEWRDGHSGCRGLQCRTEAYAALAA